MGAFVGEFVVTPHPEVRRFWQRRPWRVLPPFRFESTRYNITARIDEPFDTDFASNPRWLPVAFFFALMIVMSGVGLSWLTPFAAWIVKWVVIVLAFLAMFFGVWATRSGDEGSVIHDLLYRRRICDRKTADGIFLEALIDSGVNHVLAFFMYRMVRLFGWYAYPKTPQPMSWSPKSGLAIDDKAGSFASWAIIVGATTLVVYFFLNSC